MTLKPIETYYNGYRFRSRLEARWAVFFDHAKIRYQYEPEGFEVKIGESEVIRYLPDFYLPDLGVYAEVKPAAQKLLEDERKLAWMIDYGGPMADGLLILGQIPNIERASSDTFAAWVPIFMLFKWRKGICDHYVTFAGGKLIETDFFGQECTTAPELPTPFLEDARWSDLWLKFSYFPREVDGVQFVLFPLELPRLAYNAARQARFEHGEVPRG